jgi:hypothetical protein
MRRALVLVLLLGCEKEKKAVPVDGGRLRACYTEAACDGLRAGDRCFFAQPHSVDPEGFCARPEPPCVQSHPFCSMEGKTVYACRFPAVPWKHAGTCEDAPAP